MLSVCFKTVHSCVLFLPSTRLTKLPCHTHPEFGPSDTHPVRAIASHDQCWQGLLAICARLLFTVRLAMDLLAGYESDASSSSESQEAPPQRRIAESVKPSLPSWASKPHAEQNAGLMNTLPAPSAHPARRKRRTLPMTLQYVPDSDEEVGILI